MDLLLETLERLDRYLLCLPGFLELDKSKLAFFLINLRLKYRVHEVIERHTQRHIVHLLLPLLLVLREVLPNGKLVWDSCLIL